MSIDQMRQGATVPSGGGDGPDEFKFDTPGQEIYGQITACRFGLETKFGEGNLIELTDHQKGPVTVWLSNVQLRAGLVDGQNQAGRQVAVGDTVYIRYEGTQALEGGKTLKNFAINVQPGGAAPAPTPAAAAPAAAPTTGAPVPF